MNSDELIIDEKRSVSVAMAGLIVWAALLPFVFAHNEWTYSWDSAPYIEVARSILAGRGFEQRVHHNFGTTLWEPMRLWPPGYPIAIASLDFFGIAPERASVVVASIAGAVSVAGIAFLATRVLAWPIALLCSLAIIAMPAFLHISTQALSDSLFLACVLSTFGTLWYAMHRAKSPAFVFFVSGVLAGAAWTVRNVGLALFAAGAFFFFLQLLSQPLRVVARRTVLWFAGVAVCAAPLLIRNIMVFGKLNPYSMGKSELTLWNNVDRTGDIAVRDLTGLPEYLAGAATNKYVLLAALVMLALLVWRLAGRVSRSMFREFIARRPLELTMCVYALAYITIVIVARTKYRWGEVIDSRHLVQVYWIVFLLVAIGIEGVVKLLGATKRTTSMVLASTFALAILVQGMAQLRWMRRPAENRDSTSTAMGRDVVKYLATDVSRSQIVLSTRSDLLRVHANINARKLPAVASYHTLQPITLSEFTRLGDSGFLWGIVVEDVRGALNGVYDELIKDMIAHPERFPQLSRVEHPGRAIIMKYVPPAAASAPATQ